MSPTIQESNGVSNGNGAHVQHRPLPSGIHVPIVCIFDPETEDLDLEAIKQHAVSLAQAGVKSITVHGSNGEAVNLTHDERVTVIKAIRLALKEAGFPDLPLVAGCSAQSTRETVKLIRDAAEAGADYALVLVPSYYKGLFEPSTIKNFYHEVADTSPLPILIYNYPGAVSGLDLNSDIITELSNHPNIVGCKFTCGNTGKLYRVAAATAHTNKTSSSSPFLCFGGSGDFTIQTMISGGAGIIGGIANIAPKTCVYIYDLCRQGKWEEAKHAQAVLARGDWAAIKSGVVGVKAAMRAHRGYGGFPRRPLPGADGEKEKAYADEFRELVEFENKL